MGMDGNWFRCNLFIYQGKWRRIHQKHARTHQPPQVVEERQAALHPPCCCWDGGARGCRGRVEDAVVPVVPEEEAGVGAGREEVQRAWWWWRGRFVLFCVLGGGRGERMFCGLGLCLEIDARVYIYLFIY